MENAPAQTLAQVWAVLDDPGIAIVVGLAGVLTLVLGVLIGRRSRRPIVVQAPPRALLESRVAEPALPSAPAGAYQQFLLDRGVARAEIEARMRELLDQFDTVSRALETAAADTFRPDALEEARAVIAGGAFDRAVEILGDISGHEATTGREQRRTAERRLAATAALEALMGDLMFAATAFPVAAKHYLEAIQLLPEADEKARTAYLNKHGTAAYSAGSFMAAADSFETALAIRERTLDPHDPELATALNNLAMVRYALGRYEAAEPLYKRALAVDEHNHGPDHPAIATGLNNLALLYKKQGNLEAAEPLLRRALVIKEKVLPAGDPSLLRGLRNYASVLRALRRHAEADRLEARAASLGAGEPAVPPAEPAAESRAAQA